MIKMKNSGVEWIGEIPDEWETIRNKRIMKKVKNICEHYNNENVLSLTMNGVIVRDLDNPNGKMPLTFDGYQYINENNLLMCLFDIDVTPRCVGIIKNNGVTSPAYSQFELTERSDVNYFYYYYLYLDNKKELLHLSKNLRYSLTENQLGEILVPLPPKSTQQRIASYLDKKCSKIEETIQNQQQVIEKLKAYKRSLITEAVTGKIKIQNGKVCGKYESYKDSGVVWIGKIPSEWEVGKFGRFAQVKSNLVEPNLYLEYPQIAPDNIGKGSGKLIDWQTVKDSGVISWNHLFFKGQIVYSKIRPTLNKLIIAPFDGLCSADMYPIETNIHKQFFVYMMLSQYFVEQVGLIIRDRVKMPKINQNELSGILIIVPTKEEQKEISDYLDKKCTAIDTAIEQKQKLIVKLTEYKKSLIYECVTGKKEI